MGTSSTESKWKNFEVGGGRLRRAVEVEVEVETRLFQG
jgi:hypothetical protein